MELALVKHHGGVLVPDGPLDEAFVSRLKSGDVLTAEFKKVRNGAHHRKLHVLLTIMYQSQERFANWRDMMIDVKVKAGHYSHHITQDGNVVYIPRSYSYREMGQEDFEPFYTRIVDIALTDSTYLHGMSADVLEREINRRLNFA